jgi:hypothetical protein
MNQHERDTLYRLLAHIDLTAASALALGAAQSPGKIPSGFDQSGDKILVPAAPSLSVRRSSITAVAIDSPIILEEKLVFDGVIQM